MKIGGRAHTLAEAEFICRAGFPFVEISLVDPDSCRGDFFNCLEGFARTYGISYLAHGPEEGDAWNPGELRRAYLPRVRSLLECAARLGAAVFTLHFWLDPRFIPGPVSTEKIELLRELSEYSQSCGVQLCIENLSERAEDLTAAFIAAPALGMTLDLGHGQLLAERNTAFGFAETHPGRIRHVHAHDNRGGGSPRDDLHLTPGSGIVDFAGLLKALRATGYDGTITLEIDPAALADSSRLLERLWQQASV